MMCGFNIRDWVEVVKDLNRETELSPFCKVVNMVIVR
jgi:hypothetical protein